MNTEMNSSNVAGLTQHGTQLSVRRSASSRHRRPETMFAVGDLTPGNSIGHYAKSFILTSPFRFLHTRPSPPLFAFPGFPFDTRDISDIGTRTFCAHSVLVFLPALKFSEVDCDTHPLD